MDWNVAIHQLIRITCAIFGLVLLVLSLLLVYNGCLVDNAVFQYSVFIVPEDFANTSRAAILMGVFLFGILWLQISGTVQEWAFIMFLNAALLGYLVVIGGLLLQNVVSDEKRLNSKLYYGLLTSLKRYGEDSEFGKDYRMGWTHVQLSKHCCGTNNYTDWEGVPTIPHDPVVPISCCKRNKVAFCSDNISFRNVTADSQFIHVEGCYPYVKADIPLSNLWNVVLPFEIIASLSAIMSAYLAWKWRNRRREERNRVENHPTTPSHENLIED